MTRRDLHGKLRPLRQRRSTRRLRQDEVEPSFPRGTTRCGFVPDTIIVSPKMFYVVTQWQSYRGNVSSSVVIRYYERQWAIAEGIAQAFASLHPPINFSDITFDAEARGWTEK